MTFRKLRCDCITLAGHLQFREDGKGRGQLAFRRNDSLVLVEYDGDEHYRDSLKIKADREKDRISHENQMTVVRVPYWVQLDSVTASFCELGIDRFKHDLEALPPTVRDAVIHSLQERVKENGLEYVLPSSLRALMGL